MTLIRNCIARLFPQAADLKRQMATLQAERDAARQHLPFFKCVIQSGESWTETCERNYREAIGELRRS